MPAASPCERYVALIEPTRFQGMFVTDWVGFGQDTPTGAAAGAYAYHALQERCRFGELASHR